MLTRTEFAILTADAESGTGPCQICPAGPAQHGHAGLHGKLVENPRPAPAKQAAGGIRSGSYRGRSGGSASVC